MTAALMPCLRYYNAVEMIDWLYTHFGFARHAVYSDGEIVHHAQLVRGTDMIMLGSTMPQGEYALHTATPMEANGRNTMGCYLVEPEVDALYERLVKAQVHIVIAIKDEDYGGRGFTCKDPEGYLWNFGSYDPWDKKQ